jgi:hypothetical protein
MKCIILNCDSTELVYSGIAALMLGGIPTEKVCYPHANIYAQIDSITEKVVQE